MRLATASRYWRTVRHLKPQQVLARLKPAPRARVDTSPAPPTRDLQGQWRHPAERQPSMTGETSFRFLNESGAVSHGWEPPGKDKLWLYNLHYFDDLNAAGAPQRSEWHRRLIASWLEQVPEGSGTGWEPYPLSLRLVNWVKWALAGNALPADAVQSLAVQVRWLARRIEWHILGNHLFSNAKALVFAGTFFRGTEAEEWLHAGLNILSDELDEQILGDGGHFERSPMYHSLAVEDVLDLINLLRSCGGTLGPEAERLLDRLEAKLPSMLHWMEAMRHPDGEISFFNDAAVGIAPPPAELVRYAVSLGFEAPRVGGSLIQLDDSGYVRMSAGNAVVIADAAPVGPDYLPGHAHADTLSFEMSLGERRVVVNSGTSLYGRSPERLRQRGTPAHSTAMIDGLDSSEVWSGFRVGRRARPSRVSHDFDSDGVRLEASHDGYRWLAGRPIHSRFWLLRESGVTVTDQFTGKGTHSIDIFFHLAPWIAVEPLGQSTVRLSDADSGAAIAEVSSESSLPIEVEAGSWHPEFGRSVPNQRLRVATAGPLPLSHVLKFQWIAE